jgi:uncharacterized membrane protein
MADLTRMTKSALEKAADANPAKGANLLSDPKGLAAAGVAMAAIPLAVEQIAKRVAPKVSELGDQAKDKASAATSGLGDQAKEAAKGAVADKVPGGGVMSKLMPGGSDESSGGGLLSKLMPGSGDDESEEEEGQAAPGHGSGRRMPIQQGVDVAVPLKVAYNRWTQFEDWPDFMHRVESVEQVDDSTVAITTKIWGINRRFEAEIQEQHPDKRIEWNAEEGLAHTGVVTFHKLSDRLTRIELTVDVEPHGLIEKAGRGMRFSKRAIRGDLHRFKAHAELNDEDEGGWRGTIEDGQVKSKTERRSSGSRRRQSSNGSKPSSGRSRASNGKSRSSGGGSRGRSSA